MYREPQLPPDVPPEGGAVARALVSRRSVRAFLSTPIPRGTIESILAIASRAPSGTNAQPWKVCVCIGSVRDALAADLTHAHYGPESARHEEYAYYSRQWRDPYLGRRRKLGWDLYGLRGIAKGDRSATARQHAHNFDFFIDSLRPLSNARRGPWSEALRARALRRRRRA